MTKLTFLKRELDMVNHKTELGKHYHILFNTKTNGFMAFEINNGRCLDMQAINVGWVDISELCEWFGRKVNYANCRMYALKVLENDALVREHVELYRDVILSYEKLDTLTDYDESAEGDFTKEEIEESKVENYYAEIIEKCESSDYAYYAVRREDCVYNSGDYAFNSCTLMQYPEFDDECELIYPLCTEGCYKGFYVGPMLIGTCGIMFYDIDTLNVALQDLNYSGDRITIIAGDSFEYGNDINEVIIHNAQVIAQYQYDEVIYV